MVVLSLAACGVSALAQEAPPADDLVPSAAPASAASDDGPLEWEFSWQGWDGLYMELVRKTRFDNSLPFLRFDQVRLSGKVGLRLEVDGAAFDTNGDLTGFDDGFELRRARIKLKGDAILGVPFRYSVDIGYVPRRFSVNDFYVAVPGIEYLGTVQFGQFQPAMGLQLLTSSWNIELMEPAAPLQAIAPGTSPGIQIGRPFLGDRATWTLGMYGSGTGNSEYGSAGKSLETLIGRMTWLAVDNGAADRAEGDTLLHVGLSANLQIASHGQVRFRSRPESYIAPYVVDTGTIDTDKVSTLGAELAWVNGRFSVQGEAIHSAVSQSGGSTLNFGGLYLMTSWSLTGETRPYDRQSGIFGRLVPFRDFSFGDGGWGAAEAVLRYSYTDLTDRNVDGGRLSLLMAGFNWYLQPHLTWRFNLGVGSVRGGAADGRMVIAQTRFGLDF